MTSDGFTHREVIANGLRFHTTSPEPQGCGPLVLCLHGFPEFWYSWRRQMPVLAAAGFHVVAPDQRGYNDTDKPASGYDIATLSRDVDALIRVLGYDRAHLVAHDWGGVVAWDFAARYPHRVDRLVVLNAPHPGAYARDLRRNFRQIHKSWYVFFFQIPWLPERLLARNGGGGIKQALRRTSLPGTFGAADLQRYAEAFCKPGAATATVNWYRVAGRNFLRRTPIPNDGHIAAPTLLLWGVKDTALDLSLTRGLEQWAPDLTIRLIPEASHWVQQDAPDLVNRCLVEFLL